MINEADFTKAMSEVLSQGELVFQSRSPIDSVLAIDAASRTGWAFLDTEGAIFSGDLDLRKLDTHGQKINEYRHWLDARLSDLLPAVVAYEVPAIGLSNRISGNEARLLLGGLYGATVSLLESRQTACLHLSAKSVKMAVTGSGNANKAQVLASVRGKGFDVAHHDEADAVAILLTAMRDLGLNDTTERQDAFA